MAGWNFSTPAPPPSSVIEGGGLQILQNATATGAIITQGGVQLLESGAVASNTTLQAGAVQIVLPGATVTGNSGSGHSINFGAVAVQGTQAPVFNPTTPELLSGLGGYEFVLTGGSVSNAAFTDGASQYVYAGTVTGTTLEAGSVQYLEGGTAYNTQIDLGGSVTIGNYSTGGLAVDNTINGGTLLLNTDGTLDGTLYFAGTDSTFATDQVLFSTILSLPVMSGFVAGDVLDFTAMQFQTGVSSLSMAGDVLTINGALWGAGAADIERRCRGQFPVPGGCQGRDRAEHREHRSASWQARAWLCRRVKKPVEALRAGDEVLTAHAGPMPIRWVGQRSYGGPFSGRQPAMPAGAHSGRRFGRWRAGTAAAGLRRAWAVY